MTNIKPPPKPRRTITGLLLVNRVLPIARLFDDDILVDRDKYTAKVDLSKISTTALQHMIHWFCMDKLFPGARQITNYDASYIQVESIDVKFHTYVGTHTLHRRVIYVRITSSRTGYRWTLRLIAPT